MTIVQRSPLVEKILACAIDVHRALGPGLLESTYEQCLAYEFTVTELAFRREVALPVLYRGVQMNCGYRLDFVIDDSVLVEIKSVEQLTPLHSAQVMTYLKLSGHTRALLINFNVRRLMDGVKSFLRDKSTIEGVRAVHGVAVEPFACE